MSIPELARATQISRTTVKSRIDRFKENNLVIQGKGNKWHPTLVLWVAPVAEMAEVVSGEKVVMMPPSIPQIIEGEAPQNAPERAPEAAQAILQKIPDLPPEKPEPEPYREPKALPVKISDKAKRIAEKLRVPGHLVGRGEVSMARVARCILCKTRTTPLRYGNECVCPLCARGGV
jgi:hypothetical protein